MGHFRHLVVGAAAIVGTALVGGASAQAAPVGAAASAPLAAAGAPIETVQWGYGYGPGYGFYGPRPYYGPGPGYGYYGPRRYGPPVVCRFRPSPWGPRRVCFRRY